MTFGEIAERANAYAKATTRSGIRKYNHLLFIFTEMGHSDSAFRNTSLLALDKPVPKSRIFE
jgi:hypothetical protein